MRPVVLASASPRRAALLSTFVPEFEVLPSVREEPFPTDCPPAEAAIRVADSKARDVASKRPEHVVIGADTVVLLEGRALGKPKDRAAAREMLEALSGQAHDVITGVSVRVEAAKRCETFASLTRVFFRLLAPDEIEAYVQSGEADDKAGAYGIQGKAAIFAHRIEGDYSNVVGLPLAELYLVLRKLGAAGPPGGGPEGA